MNLATAKMLLTKNMNDAFTKKAGTKQKRVDYAKFTSKMCPTDSRDSMALMIWAIDFAGNWKAA